MTTDTVMNDKTSLPRFVRFMDRLNGLLIKLCGLAFAIMVVSIFFGILIRFVFSHLALHIAAPWTDELARYLLIWSVFIAGGVGARTGQLIGIDILVTHLPARIGQSAKYIVHALSIGFYVALMVIGWRRMEFGQIEMSPVMDIPMSMVFAAMMVGGLLMALNTIALILEARSRGKDIRHAASAETEIDDLVNQYATETQPQGSLK